MAKINTNKAPYYDQHNIDLNRYRVLFKPSRAVQTQELNELQSILNGQTEALSNHFFKFGSRITAGNISVLVNQDYVRFKDGIVNPNVLSGATLQGKTSGLTAIVIHFFDDGITTAYVNYTNTATDNVTASFIHGEEVDVLDENLIIQDTFTVRCPNCETPDVDNVDPTGKGSIASVDEAIYYVNGFFVKSFDQTITLDAFGTTPSYHIGFDIQQSEVSAFDDDSLYDNSVGSPNFNEEGADRYVIKLVLTKKPLDVDFNGDEFVKIAEVDAGNITNIKSKPEYADILELLNTRINDHAGDFIVKDMTVNFKEHLKESDGDNDGLLTAANGGDASKFGVIVSDGLCYVNGARVEFQSETVIETPKARDIKKERGNVTRNTHGNFVRAKLSSASNFIARIVNTSDNLVSNFEEIFIYDGAITNGNVSGAIIGSCKIKSMEILEGLPVDPNNTIYKLNIFDVSLITGKSFSDVRAIAGFGLLANLEPDPIDSTYKIYSPSSNTLIYPIGFNFTSSIRDFDNPNASNTSITISRRLTTTTNASGIATFSLSGNESFSSFNPLKWMAGVESGGVYEPFDLIGNITVTSTSVSIDVGLSNNSVSLIADILVTNASEKSKSLNTEYLINITPAASISLGKVDVFRLLRVYNTTQDIDVTANYTLNPNQKDNIYDISLITLNSGADAPDIADKLEIDFDYLQHSDNGLFFSIDSYKSLINDNNIDFDYEDVPVYTTNNGDTVRLSDSLDFRATVDSNSEFTGAGAIVENLASNNTNVIYDVAYFLPRIDRVCVSDSSDVFIVNGAPAIPPVAPAKPANCIDIYLLTIKPYTLDIKKDVATKAIKHRRYTMKDIGELDDRIKNLEYYVSFSLLERETAGKDITDNAGNTRFKNGFVSDNFKDFLASDTKSPEYLCALDTSEGIIRPSFDSYNINLVLNETDSTGFVKNKNAITLPYTEVVYRFQPESTKTVSLNPYFIYDQVGRMQLTPTNDVWKDVTRQPDLVVDIDTGVDAIREIANLAGVMGTTWNSWQTTSTNISRDTQRVFNNTTFSRVRNGWWNDTIATRTTVDQTTTTVDTDQVRLGTNRTLEERINSQSLGERVTDVNMIPFIREQDITFSVAGLKPNTRLYVFFDGIAVTQYCRQLNKSRNEPIVSDSEGNLVGVFRVPNTDTLKFSVGQRILRVTNSSTNTDDKDELITSAEAEFFAGGLSTSRQNTILSVESPVIRRTTVQDRRTLTSTSISNQVNTTARRVDRQFIQRSDPLGQSFFVEELNGAFITGISVYFSSKPKNNNVPAWLKVVPMENGTPTSDVLPYSEIWLKRDNISTSDDSTVATKFNFEAPVYMLPNKEYCFIVGTEDKDYRIYTSELGGVSLETGAVVSTQPSLGTMFKSQNDSTWTPEQTQDIKFIIHRAEFDTNTTMNLVYNNDEKLGIKKLNDNPFETENLSQFVRVYHQNHGFVANDKVKFSRVTTGSITIDVSTGNLVTGQTLIGQTHSGTVAQGVIDTLEFVETVSPSGDKRYTVNLVDVIGKFLTGDNITGTAFEEVFEDSFTVPAGIKSNSITNEAALGNISTGEIDTPINGIPLVSFTKSEHIVQYVDSIDSYIIQLDSPATTDGRTGGAGVFAESNISANLLHFDTKNLKFDGASKWTVDTITHNTIGGSINDYDSNDPIELIENDNVELEQPIKIATQINESANLGVGVRSLAVNGTLTTSDPLISPVINDQLISMTCISNRIASVDCDTYNVAPNVGADCLTLDDTSRFKPETHATDGVESCKYVTKAIVLNNPAQNIRIFADVSSRINTTLDIYYRILPISSDGVITSEDWILSTIDNLVSAENSVDFNEISVDTGTLDTEFKSFQVKLVMRTTNSSVFPKVKRLRCIAAT